MGESGPESERAVSARERAKRLGWRVDPPRDVDDDPGDDDLRSAPRQRPLGGATAGGWGRP
ncbi:MAG: hypothetical protein M3P30_11090 [Chloroflexota bacterium]|nr:hypothetical protein [Chloroflexota bacterium]